MRINLEPHRESTVSRLSLCLWSGSGACAWGEGETAARGDDSALPQAPILGAARFIPIAHRVDFRYNPNRSDKIQNHRSKHWLSSAVGTETFV